MENVLLIYEHCPFGPNIVILTDSQNEETVVF